MIKSSRGQYLPEIRSEVFTVGIELGEDLTVVVGLLGVWRVERILLGSIGKVIVADQRFNVVLQVLEQRLLLMSNAVGESLLWSPGKMGSF